MDFDAVGQAMREAHRDTVAPYFGRLSAGDIEEKTPGDLVTVADRACEERIGPMLRGIVDAPIVGEEAVAADPSVVDQLRTADSAWLVDPIDGTANFAAGRPEYALMVAFVERGQATASWIYQPQFDLMAVAARGAGATLNGEPVQVAPPGRRPKEWTGVVKDRFLPDDLKRSVIRNAADLGMRNDGYNCAGMEYPALLVGELSFLFYWRTLPWDHVPGVLLAEEAGCSALRPDGQRFSLLDDRPGLLVASSSVAPDVLQGLLGTGNLNDLDNRAG